MFKVLVQGRIASEPKHHIINSREVCQFSLIVRNKINNKTRKSLIRCTAFDEDADFICTNWSKDKTVTIVGEGSNCPYDTKNFKFSLEVTTITMI